MVLQFNIDVYVVYILCKFKPLKSIDIIFRHFYY